MKVALVLNQLRDGEVPDHMVSLELAAIMRGCQEIQPNWPRRTLAIALRYRRNLCQTNPIKGNMIVLMEIISNLYSRAQPQFGSAQSVRRSG